MSNDPEFDKQQYERWLNTPYSKAVRIPKKKDSHLGAILLAGAAVVGGALIGKRIKGANKIGTAVGKVEKEVAKVESKVVSVPAAVTEAHKANESVDLIKAQYPDRSKFDQVNEDLANIDLPKEGKLPSSNKTVFDSFNEDLAGLELPKAAVKTKTTFEVLGEEMQQVFKQNQTRKGSTSKPRLSKKSAPANKGSSTRLKAAAKTVSVAPSAAPKIQSAQIVQAKVTEAKTVKVPGSKPRTALTVQQSIVNTSVPDPNDAKLKGLVEQIQQSQDLNVREKLLAEAEAVLNSSKKNVAVEAKPSAPAASPVKRNARLEKRLAARAKQKGAEIRAGLKPNDDPGTAFLREKGYSEIAEDLNKPHGTDDMPDEIRQASRPDFEDDPLQFESERNIRRALQEKGGRKSSFSDLIVNRSLPKSMFDPAETAKAALAVARKNK